MSKLTPEQREKLDGELAAITESLQKLQHAAAPFLAAIAVMEGQFEAVGSRFGVITYHDMARCEECNCIILDDDPSFQYDDGPALCEEHAPTYAETERELVEAIELQVIDDDGDATKNALANVRAKIAEGRGDEKNVW